MERYTHTGENDLRTGLWQERVVVRAERLRKKLDDECWATAEVADRADKSLVGYESHAECDQGSVE